MYKRDKRKNAVIYRSIFLITTLSLCFSLLFFSNIIDMTESDLIGPEIEEENDNGQPVASQEDKNPKISKLESGVADSNIHNRTEQATERVEVSRSAPSKARKYTQSNSAGRTPAGSKIKGSSSNSARIGGKAPAARNMSGAKESYSAEDLDLLPD